MGFEDRRTLRGVGRRLLGVLCIYAFGAAALLAVMMAVPFVREAVPELAAEAEASGTVDQGRIVSRFLEFLKEHSDGYQRMVYIVSAIAALLGALVFLPAMRREEKLGDLYAPGAFSWRLWGLSVAAMMGLNYLGSLAVLGTEWLFNAFGYSILLPDDEAFTPMYYIYAVLIGPVAEEWIFRGGVLRALKPYGRKFALVASSVCFAFFHGNLNQFPGVLLMGLMLGYLCLATDSLLMPTLAHMGLNALVSAVQVAVEWRPMLALPVLAVGLVGGILALKALRTKLGPVAPEEPETSREVKNTFYFSLPMLVFFAICLYNIVGTVSAI